jgi:glutathione S-transferase
VANRRVMTETTLTFYWGSGSPWAWRAMLGLELKGLEYESKLLQFSKGEHRSPQMLALNPRGKVPVLVHGDTVVYESLAILAYLDRAFPEPGIFGVTAQEAAHVWRLVSEHDAYVVKIADRVVRPLFTGKPEGVTEKADDIRAAIEELHTELAGIEQQLGKGSWLVGKTPSAADAVYFVTLQQVLRAVGKPVAEPLQLGFTPLEQRYPKLAAWEKRFAALPGVQRTWPPHWT